MIQRSLIFFSLKIEFKRDDAVNLPFYALIYRGVRGQGHYPLVVRIAKFIKKEMTMKLPQRNT